MTKIKFSYSTAHFGRDSEYRVSHGPQVWEWWRFISLSVVRLRPWYPPSAGYRLWIYTEFGALRFDVVFDRREPTK